MKIVKQFCLSDKIKYPYGIDTLEGYIRVSDFKKFVKILKEFDDFETDHYKKEYDKMIDDLVGQKLVKK